jgi:hypothetical protein
MGKLSKSLIPGFFLALLLLPPLHSQTSTSVAADAHPATSNTAPSGQAPNEATRKITELVHAGKYVEAQQLTTGLLVAYPDDQRLIKAKTLIERMSSSPGSPAVPNGQPPNSATVVQPAPSTPTGQLTGMDKVNYDSLIELGREAQQTTDLDQQKKLLQQFMDHSNQFLRNHPNEMLLWQLRGASAISLDDPVSGYEAGERLLAAGAANSGDANMRHLLAQLNLKGWLDKDKHQATEQEKQQATWTDSTTGSIWTRQDNGSDLDWSQAKDYCSNLRLAGYATWQLPSTEELAAINDQVSNGSIKLSNKANLAWSTRVREPSGEPCYFMFDQRGSHCATNRRFVRALCIRRPIQQ